jgi:uncharacterized repeat protein (TIGR02543 family)
MNMKLPLAHLLLCLLLPAAACPGATFTVEIRNFYFTPTNLVIQPGDTVVWRNTSFTPHDTTHRAPVGSRLWASPVLAQNETFSRTFTAAGVFPYMCALHVGNFPQQTGTVSVVAANVAPTVQITSPAAGAAFTAPASFTIAVTANDSDGTVANVQFFANGALLGTSATPPFTFQAAGLAAGSYAITAVATDNQGATGSSAAVNITVSDAPVNHLVTLGSSPGNGGTISPNPPQPAQGYPAGSTVSLAAVPADGFTFSGWSGDASGTQNPLSLVVDGPRTITANFTPVVVPTYPLLLTVDPAAAGSIAPNPLPNAAGGMYVEGTVVTLTATPAAGFAFTNWSGDASGTSNQVTVVMSGPRSVTARFTPVALSSVALELLVQPAAGGSIQANPLPNAPGGRYLPGTTVALTAIPSLGFSFSNWSGAVSGTNPVINTTLVADQSVTATFVPAVLSQYTLTTGVVPASGGSVVVIPPSTNGFYAAGTQLAIIAQPAPGFQFLGWTGDVTSTNNPILLLMNSDKVLNAEFARVPALDFKTHRGAYMGLALDETGTNYSASGSIRLRLSSSGSFQGTALLGGIRTPFRGQFDRAGYAPFAMRGGSLLGSLQIDPSSGRIDSFLAESTNITTGLRLYADQSPTNFAGLYELLIPFESPVAEPGQLAIEVRSNGAVRIRGRLGDGASVTDRTFVTSDGQVPLFVPLYHGHGALIGWLDLEGEDSTVSWFRPGDSRSVDYPTGFSLRLPVTVQLATP